MKNRIAFKLTLYFTLALLVFLLIFSGIFIFLFKRNTVELNKIELEKRATKISETLSPIIEGNTIKVQGKGYGAYIKFLNDIAMADVWIVDENLNIITSGKGLHSQYSFSELPLNAENIVKDVFKGKTAFSESFSSILDTSVLTVGTPIISSNDIVIGVVLLHSPINGINLVIAKGIFILSLSVGIALIIAVLLSITFSVIFTKPLNKMNNTAIKLADGNYTVKNNIKQGDEIGTLANNMDILSDRLYLSSKESEKLEQLRRDFIANISHELRTPITVIRGSLEALNDEVVTEENQVKEYYKQMLNESINLQRLIGDLLDLSRLQNTEFKIEMLDVNIYDVINDIIRSAKNIAKSKNIELLLVNTATNCSICGDYGRLRQMFMTLLDNAIKFSPQNGHINITLSRNESLNISIKDEGIGIEKQDLPYLFERFYKTKAIENTNGTGLGLSIAKQIALRHNAKICVNSLKSKGSEFIVKFPLTILTIHK
ncbi:HAMP domain-containing protein [Sedimentibacter sp. zth1]|uniref:sensor histidine kinase n=1 Tax=Sedimentibacter sp. zth1 TaxID=2816908 RepID=UPI001A921E3F|nr:ATP-binding protein [Sedimentibacter sp. zth1]QSX06476.1 HAMP domain-containing protein [Sedimentibacter sp. zth1]